MLRMLRVLLAVTALGLSGAAGAAGNYAYIFSSDDVSANGFKSFLDGRGYATDIFAR